MGAQFFINTISSYDLYDIQVEFRVWRNEICFVIFTFLLKTLHLRISIRLNLLVWLWFCQATHPFLGILVLIKNRMSLFKVWEFIHFIPLCIHTNIITLGYEWIYNISILAALLSESLQHVLKGLCSSVVNHSSLKLVLWLLKLCNLIVFYTIILATFDILHYFT